MGNNVYLYCMHACTQNHIVHSLSVVILDVAKTVFLLYNASMLVSVFSTFQVIYILIQKTPTSKFCSYDFCNVLDKLYCDVRYIS